MHVNEKKWQKEWAEAKLNEANRSEKPKYYLIFAYPGVSGFLHVGHMRGYSYSDIITRYKRMQGFNVLFPAGFHATGIHAVGISEKIKRGDQDAINYFKENGVSEEQIKKFKDYKEVLKFFFDVYENDYWRRFGFLIDWRRLTNTLAPGYSKFIQWQFRKLHERDLLVQKEYYGAFCPNCGPVAVDPSETDIKQGGNAEKQEYTLLKFPFEDAFLLAATLRPETVYGQTNMWIRPDINYVKAKVNDEKWIISKECAESLEYQGKKVEVLEEIPGKKLVGKYCHAPGAEKDIIILPSTFPDPNVGTGLVTSVPSDAPYDYIALQDLWKNKKECAKYGLNPQEIKNMKIIPIIKSKGYGQIPAKEIIEKMGITNQEEHEKLEQATQEIYKIGFHTGIMRNTCGPYEGMRVEEAKEEMKEKMISEGKAEVFYSFSEPVICRCGRNVVIKEIKDQWFIKYSDPSLTEKSKMHAETMNIQPERYKEQMPGILDWFQDRACARQGSWLGTRFPFNEDWIIEPISDSTLYPAYYIISKYENQGKIKPEEMTESFFDYVFLGLGEPKTPAWKEAREDFEYWYPLDVNLGGKEHKTVHFPVFLMNHVAVLPGTFWPKGVFAHWWVLGKAGSKMSKSKGGAASIPNILENYSADSIRLYYSHIASPFQDISWDPDAAYKYQNAVEKVFYLCQELSELNEGKQRIDSWLKHNFNDATKKATEAMEENDLRTASDEIFYRVPRDLQWYKRRGGGNKKLLDEILQKWIQLTTPFTPHVAEKTWHEIIGKKSLVSSTSWPEQKNEVKSNVNQEENLVRDVLSDARDIFDLVDKKPEKMYVYTPAEWKWNALELMRKTGRDFSACMKAVASKHGKKGAGFVKAMFKKLPEYSNKKKVDEHEVIENAKQFLSGELGVEVHVFRETDENKYDPKNKASRAMPLYPAIFVE